MTDDSKYEFDIFISYNRADEAWAKQLATRLEKEVWQDRKRRLKVFFAPWDIKPGESILERLEYAIPRSRKVALILSPESVESEWVKVERYVTHHIDITERQKRLIPLYLSACEIPTFLNHINYIDFQDDAKFEENYRILLATIKDEPLPRGGGGGISSNSTDSLPPAIPRRPAVGFVQREDERGRNILELLKEELTPENNQLIVLWGRGGAGKTTLAAEAVREMSATFPDRIVWTSARDTADFKFTTLLNEIVAQLGRPDLRTLATEQKEEQVRSLIDDAPTLIVLDNFETIKADEQKLCVQFLATRAPCPALITTREEINEDEVNNISLDAMLLEEARELLRRLIERTRRPKKFDALDHDEIIRKTEYNPLLLKWVVRQIDLAQKPETALNYLAQGDTDVAERIFDRSFNLPRVGDNGRAALLALSLFVPDASRKALAEVAGFGNDLPRLDKAVENLAAVWLVDTIEEGDRLLIRGLTHERAKAHLAKDARATQFRQRFVAYFLKYTEEHQQPTPEDFDALEAEKDNLLKAMDTSFDSGDLESVVEMTDILAAPVTGMLSVRGYWDDAIQRGKQALQVARNAQTDARVAFFAHNVAVIYQNRGDWTKARRLYDESLEINKKLDNQSGIASTLHELGRIKQSQGEFEEARRLYDESLEIERQSGNQSGIASTLHQLAIIARKQGEFEEARRLYDESLEIEKKLGNQSGIAITLLALAVLLSIQVEFEEARRLYGESLVITKKLGDKSTLALIYYNLGLLTKLEGNNREAVRLLYESLSMFEELRSPDSEMVRQELARIEEDS